MQAKVTVINFFKMGRKYEFIRDGKLYSVSIEAFSSIDQKYKQEGFRVSETSFTVSYVKIENEIEMFLENLRERY